ncbi:protein transport protein [Tanacetum coccineum]|uniref:Protein transport protein n=1 Tax=Tanacetum coccineum TaxID=301880 RepID=A0ABQ4YAX3_9ASTR
MGPVSDHRARMETAMEASTSKNHTSFMSMPKGKNLRPECKNEDVEVDILNCTDEDVDVDVMNCTDEDVEVDVMNCTNEDAEVDAINCTNNDEDAEVDIVNCTNNDEVAMVETHSDDATATSSSFGDLFSDGGSREYGSDSEVMSELREDSAPMRGLGGSGDLCLVRKKRVTSHWRKFVQPIMWRCKWAELQLRKFHSLGIKFDTELEKINQTKHLKYGNFALEGRCAKSVPFVHDCQRQKPLKRKIRKSHEDLDPEVYMSQHNLFSCFGKVLFITSFLALGRIGGKMAPLCVWVASQKVFRSASLGPIMDDDQTNLAPAPDKNAGNEFRVPDELLSLEFRDDYSFEQLLYKIEVSQSRLCEMKDRLDILMEENEERIASAENIILPESNNGLVTCPIRESDFPINMGGPSIVADLSSQLIKLNTANNVIKSEAIDLGQGEGTHLQVANGPMEQPIIASRKRGADGIVIYNRRAKKSQTDPESVKVHPIEKLLVPKEEENNTAPHSVSEDSSQNDHPAPKIRSVTKLSSPKNKNKRAARPRRKTASSLWSRRMSG